MSGERFTLDTNVLVYAIDLDAGERHTKAVEIVDQAAELDTILSLQALSEFFFAVTRKGKMPMEEAAAQVHDWQLVFPVVVARPDTLSRAISAAREHNLGFWDALLWATVKTAGVTVLLSEDFQDGRELDGVRFRNPFVTENPFGTHR